MSDLSLFLFVQIDKISENFVRPDEYLPIPINISFGYYTHALTTILLWILCSFVRIKFKMVDFSPFFGLKLTKYLKMLSIRINISNTNEYLFPIIYTCIYYNPPMNPYDLQHSFYPVGDTIVLAIYLFLYKGLFFLINNVGTLLKVFSSILHFELKIQRKKYCHSCEILIVVYFNI